MRTLAAVTTCICVLLEWLRQVHGHVFPFRTIINLFEARMHLDLWNIWEASLCVADCVRHAPNAPMPEEMQGEAMTSDTKMA